jgi:hypothetical protein
MAMDPPRPQTQIVHNHSTPWGSIILVGFLCFLLFLPVLWMIGVFILSQAGVRQPARALANGIIYLAFGLPLLALVSWIVSNAVPKILDCYFAHQERMKELDAEQVATRALTAGAPALPNERLTEEDKRLFENLAMVMEQAYRDYATHGSYRNGNVQRPWSKAAVLALDPPRHGRMPERKATQIREWLAEKRVIIGEPQQDQINHLKYPTWSDFRALLEDEFNMPVVVAPPSYDSSGYVHIT